MPGPTGAMTRSGAVLCPCHRHRQGCSSGSFGRLPLGNMAIGVVTEVGAAVTEFRVGDRVFGHLPIRETHTVEAGRVDLLPAGLTPQAAVCLDPLVMALPMREGNVQLGDRVAVFGLGAIGQMAVQLAPPGRRRSSDRSGPDQGAARPRAGARRRCCP